MSIHPEKAPYWLQLWFSQVGEATLQAEREVLEYLSKTERGRLARIRHEGKRREYLLSRMLMRHALGETFRRAASQWRFVEQNGATPRIEELPAGIGVSLSHSGGHVCFGMADCALGIDIEVDRPRGDLLASAEMFMADSERACLRGDEAAQLDYFYRCWCAKEACYKSLDASLQATTTFNSIVYAELQSGDANRALIEGRGDGFHFAAALARRPANIERHHYRAEVTVELDAGA